VIVTNIGATKDNMPISTILKISLNSLINGPVVEILSEKALDKSLSILKNHFLSATEINKALQDSYSYALAAISALLASPEAKLKFLQQLTHVEENFAEQIENDYLENDYLQAFLAEQPPRNLQQFRVNAIKALSQHAKQSLETTDDLTESDLMAIISYNGSLTITDLVLQQLPKLNDELIAFLRYKNLLGNAILFFFLEQLRENTRVKYTQNALQRAGLWADMHKLESAQENIAATLKQQQTEILRQLSEHKKRIVRQRIVMKTLKISSNFHRGIKRSLESKLANDSPELDQMSQQLQRVEQEAEAIQDLLDKLPRRLQQAKIAWVASQKQLTPLIAPFQSWAPMTTEKVEVVLSALDELRPELDKLNKKLEQLSEMMAQMGVQLTPRFAQYDTTRLKNLEKAIADIKPQLIENPQSRSQIALIEGSLYFSQGDLQAAEQKFIQARDEAHQDEKRALACFNLFQLKLWHQDYPEALAALQESYAIDHTWQYALHDIDKYPIEKILGADGMGCLFLCQDQWRETQVVVKTFWEGHRGRRDDVFKEPILIHRLLERYIPKALDCGYVNSVKQERPYFVTEYLDNTIDGETLFKKHGKLERITGLNVALQVAKGLAIAHQAGVYHLDLKPANLLFITDKEDVEVKILDFGLSQVATSLKQQATSQIEKTTNLLAQSIFESLDYVPPEQRAGEPSAKSDLFAFGATMYYLLSGENPRFFHPHKLPDMAELQPLFKACLETEPEKRPEIQFVITQLSTYLDKIDPTRNQKAQAKAEKEAKAKRKAEEEAQQKAEEGDSWLIAIQPDEIKDTLSFDFEIVTVNAQGEIIHNASQQANYQREDLDNGVIIDMVSIPGGTFLMGSPETEDERINREGPQHEVTVAPFYMSKYLVTQAQWEAVMEYNPSSFKGKNIPVETVSWKEAVAFCQRLSDMTDKKYSLPTEAQWEYACRANTTTPFFFGETITSDLVNFDANYPYTSIPKGIYRQKTTDVGSFPPNTFGLYDMHGNVWEWCADPWHENYHGAPSDAGVWEIESSAKRFILRGGSWYHDAGKMRSAFRGRGLPTERNGDVGFRIVWNP